MSKQWIIKMIKGDKIVVCPDCGHKAMYPTEHCDKCNCELELPDDTRVIKKEWW